MTETQKATIFCIVLAILTLTALGIAISRVWPDTECLFYGIDFNGNRDWFGLFC